MLDVRLAKVERLYSLENTNGGRDDEARARARLARWPASLPPQAYLAFSLHADLSSSFSWNTKLLFVYLVAEYSTPLNELNQARGARNAPLLHG